MSNKRFSIIMPAYRTSKYISRALKSLREQNYSDWECFVVVDGRDNDIEHEVKKFKSDSRIQYITIDHAGAPAARNAGAKLATGDYLAFFSSDFKAQPGMLESWAIAFEDNPDCGFVYGGYGLMDNGVWKQDYNGEEFDPIQLEAYNYIDGGFPLKREHYVPWDETIKSLQDWDYWLTIVKDKGIKGHYINDITYWAEFPKVGGLSQDSHDNWLERSAVIKKKHNIRDREICVTSYGCGSHAKRLARILDADFKINPNYWPNTYKMLYLIGLFPESLPAYAQLLVDFRGLRCVHWVGTDILQLGKFPTDSLDKTTHLLQRNADFHLTEFEPTHKELEYLGLKNYMVPLPITCPIENAPLPKDFTIAVYHPVSVGTEKKYFLPLMGELVRALPNVNFLMFATRGELKERNVEYVPWMKMEDVIKRTSCLLRITPHDGLPVTSVEYLMAGRPVITTVDMPYVEHIGEINAMNYPKIKNDIIDSIFYLAKNPQPEYLTEAKKVYTKYCSADKYRERMYNLVYSHKPETVVGKVSNLFSGLPKNKLYVCGEKEKSI